METELAEIIEELSTITDNTPRIALEEIIILERKRELIEARVEILVDSIEEIGLLHPIIISPRRVLAAGRNRLEAYTRLKERNPEDERWTAIPYTLKDYDEIEMEIAEIDENLYRAELSSLERVTQLARRKELYLLKHPELLARSKREELVEEGVLDESVLEIPESGIDTRPASFVEDASSKTGRSTTTIRDETNLGEEILEKFTPEIRSLLSPTKIADNKKQLQRLLEEPDMDVRLEVAQKINEAFADGKNLSVTDVLSGMSSLTSYQSTVSTDGEDTLLRTLQKTIKALESSVNTPKFKEVVSDWTYEGLESIQEDFFRIEDLAKRGATILGDVMDAKMKLGKGA